MSYHKILCISRKVSNSVVWLYLYTYVILQNLLHFKKGLRMLDFNPIIYKNVFKSSLTRSNQDFISCIINYFEKVFVLNSHIIKKQC